MNQSYKKMMLAVGSGVIVFGLVLGGLMLNSKPSVKVATPATPSVTEPTAGTHKHADGTIHKDGDEATASHTGKYDTITSKDGEIVKVPVQAAPKEFVKQYKKAEAVAGTVLADYVDKKLTGEQVKTMLTRFKDKRVAVLLATQMVQDSTQSANVFDGNVASDVPTVSVKGMPNILNTAGKDIASKFTFVNYGAVLKGEKGKAVVTFKDNKLIAADGLDVTGETVVYNAGTENIVKQGTVEYLYASTQFVTYLVVDAKDSVIGIACYAVK